MYAFGRESSKKIIKIVKLAVDKGSDEVGGTTKTIEFLV